MTGSYVKGTVAWGAEPAAAPGMQTLLPATILAAATSATTQPVIGTSPQSVQGVRCLILVQGVAPGASATITITGKAPDGITAVTETSTAISVALGDVNGNYYYCTKAVFGSINATGITASSYATSLVSASVTVIGITSAKWLIPAIVAFDENYDEFSPADVRGIIDKNIRMEQLIQHVSFTLTSSLYPEAGQFIGPACVGNVTAPATPASIPATPTVLKASTTFTVLTTTFTLTTPPTNPGMMLQFVIAGNALAGTLLVTGTAWNTGAVQTETLNITAQAPNGTYYTQYSYASVTNVQVTGMTPAATCVVNGVFAYQSIYNPTNTLVPLAMEWYSGLDSSVCSYIVPEEFTIEYDVAKELKLTMKGVAQNKVIIGDRTVNPLVNSNMPTYAQPIDFPIPGWPGLLYLDPIGSTPATTLWADVITFKLTGKTGLKPYWTGVGQQSFNRVGREWREFLFDAEIDFINVINYDKYKAFAKFVLVAKFLSPYYLGVSGTTPQFKYVQLLLNCRIVTWPTLPANEKVTAKITGVCEYDPTSGYAFQLSYLNQNNPAFIQ
jgi:hypothetical protein